MIDILDMYSLSILNVCATQDWSYSKKFLLQTSSYSSPYSTSTSCYLHEIENGKL